MFSLFADLFSQLMDTTLDISHYSFRALLCAHHLTPEATTRLCSSRGRYQPAKSCSNHPTDQNTLNKCCSQLSGSVCGSFSSCLSLHGFSRLLNRFSTHLTEVYFLI